MQGIEHVLERHVDSLMSIPGVVGVGQSVLQHNTPCILVMVRKDTPHLRASIPKELDGHPVAITETGDIEAL